MRFVTLPSGFVTFLSASAEPFETKVSADVQLLPGRRMICEVALHNHGNGEWYVRPPLQVGRTRLDGSP